MINKDRFMPNPSSRKPNSGKPDESLKTHEDIYDVLTQKLEEVPEGLRQKTEYEGTVVEQAALRHPRTGLIWLIVRENGAVQRLEKLQTGGRQKQFPEVFMFAERGMIKKADILDYSALAERAAGMVMENPQLIDTVDISLTPQDIDKLTGGEFTALQHSEEVISAEEQQAICNSLAVSTPVDVWDFYSNTP